MRTGRSKRQANEAAGEKEPETKLDAVFSGWYAGCSKFFPARPQGRRRL